MRENYIRAHKPYLDTLHNYEKDAKGVRISAHNIKYITKIILQFILTL